MENTTWKIDNSRINIEIAKWIIETINHVKLKESLNLLSSITYHTYSEDMKFKLSLHDSGYVVITDKHANVVHWGMFHLMIDKLKTIYPSLKDL